MALPKDSWSMAIADLVLKVIVPVTIMLATFMLTNQQKRFETTRATKQRESEAEDQMFKTSFDSVTKLASQNQKERLYAVKVLGKYAQIKSLPSQLAPVLVYIAKNDPDREVQQEAARAAGVFVEVNKDSAVDPKPGADVAITTVTKTDLENIEESLDQALVYIQFLATSKSQQDEARRIMQGLKAAGISAPGVDGVGIDKLTDKTELRYFHQEDKEYVTSTVIPTLTKLGMKNVIPSLVPETKVKRNQYELWFGKPAANNAVPLAQ